ncbi:FtsQ-type POTRA domain-containing protein [bacterium]|nr:FtsQ-type POTRA domain-containing protein [bacterium]
MSGDRVAIGSLRGDRVRTLARWRTPRRSRRQTAARAAVVTVTVAMLVAGAWWMLTTPTFAVARVESGPYRFSTRAEVDRALRDVLGRNIWRLSSGEIAAAFTGLPWVREVHARRRVPDTVVVELVEWRPLLVVAPRDADPVRDLVLVGDGRVLPMPDHLDPPALPVLVGASLTEDGPDAWRIDPVRAGQVARLLDALAATGFEVACPVDFVRLTATGICLELADRAGTVHLGREAFDERLGRYLLARDRIPRGAAVDLRFADRITIASPAADQS